MRVHQACALDFSDHVVRAGMADLHVIRVVGDEGGVSAERTVKRAADRPDSGVCQPVVCEVVALSHRNEAFSGAVDTLVAAVLRKGQGVHLGRCHQRAERVARNLATSLEPEIARLREVHASLEAVEELLEGELALPGTNGVDVGFDRILRVDDRVQAAPDHICARVDRADAPNHVLREIRIARHARQGDDIGIRQTVGDAVQIGRTQRRRLPELPGHRFDEAAIASRRDVFDVRFGV